jgi:hypothetical protein
MQKTIRLKRTAMKAALLFALPLIAPSMASAITVNNPSLLFEPGAAVVTVGWLFPVNWVVKTPDGTTVASGTANTGGSTGTINLNALGPGYYELQLGAIFSSSIDTNIGIISNLSTFPSTIAAKLGTTAHPDLLPAQDYAGLVKKAGLGNLRFDMRWQQIEPSAGTYTFSPTTPNPINFDTLIGSLTTAGVKPLIVLGYNNPAYDSNARPNSVAGITGYANYAAAIAGRYGTAADYEVYNEYNVDSGVTTGPCGLGPSCYASLVQAAGGAIHGAAPGSNVVLTGIAGVTQYWLGGDTQTPANDFISYNWLKGFLDLGGANDVDVFNFHNYPTITTPSGLAFDKPEGDNEAIVVSLKSLLGGYAGATGKPLWLTETSWSTYATAPGISETLQAAYLVRDEVLTLTQGLDRYQWYDLFDDTPDNNVQGRWGLLRNPGSNPAIAPKPSFVAQAVLTRQLDGYAYSNEDAIQSGVYSMQFTKAGSPLKRVMWSATGLATEIDIATSSALTLTDDLGFVSTLTPSSGKVHLVLTGNPVYVSGGSISAIGLSNLAYGKSVTATGTDGTHPASNAVDADAESYWQGAYNIYPSALTIDLGAAHSVNRVRLSTPPEWFWRYENFSIEGSNDGTNFSTLVANAQYTLAPETGNTVSATFTASSVRYVRVSVSASTDWNARAGQFSDIEVFGP